MVMTSVVLVNLDYQAFHFLNGFAGQSNFFDGLFVVLAEYVIFLMIASLALYALINKKSRGKRLAVVMQALIAGFIGRVVIVSIIRALFFRPRPFVADTVNQLVAHDPKDASFPSGHASVMFAIAFVVLMFDAEWGVVYLIAATISATARVVVGVHFPLDILGGALVGLLSAITVRWIFKKYHK